MRWRRFALCGCFWLYIDLFSLTLYNNCIALLFWLLPPSLVCPIRQRALVYPFWTNKMTTTLMMMNCVVYVICRRLSSAENNSQLSCSDECNAWWLDPVTTFSSHSYWHIIHTNSSLQHHNKIRGMSKDSSNLYPRVIRAHCRRKKNVVREWRLCFAFAHRATPKI